MPRPNQPRSIHGEINLGDRVRLERTARGWSLEKLAIQMRHVGCEIAASAIYKSESGPAESRRRITYDEALAYSRVFDIPMSELDMPIEAVRNRAVKALLDEYDEALNGLAASVERLRQWFPQFAQAAASDPELADTGIEASVWLSITNQPMSDPSDPVGAAAYNLMLAIRSVSLPAEEEDVVTTAQAKASNRKTRAGNKR